MPDLTEELIIIGEQISRLRQFTQQPDGVEIESTTYFDHSSFAPLRMETRVTAADGSSLADSWHNLNTDGYTGISTRGGVRQEVSGKISALMLHGGAMGLPLTTLAGNNKPVTFRASMMQFDAIYEVKIEWSGTETIEHQGNKFQAFLADVRWQHHESSDVYPPGPDASGGQYWLVPNPPAGFPYVPRYQTDSYAVEFYPLVCP